MHSSTNNNKKNKKWRWQLPFLLFLIIASVLIIRSKQPHQTPYQHDNGMIFGTVWQATYQCDSSMMHSIKKALQEVDASLSMFNPHSTISRINSGECMLTDSLMRIVLCQAQQVSQATDGSFDVTVAPLVNAWGFGFRNSQLPDSLQVDSLLQFVGWQGISLRGDTLVKRDSRMVLDMSAIAKGFGVDQVASLFRRHNVENFMIEIGGEIVVSGNNPKGKKWNIGVSKPVEDDKNTNNELQTTLQLTNCAMATSGNYRNYYISDDGRKLAHTIDPKTGYPVQHSILSSTVVAPTCSMADAFATAFMVMGLDKAQEVLTRHPELKAYFIYNKDGAYETWQSPNLTE